MDQDHGSFPKVVEEMKRIKNLSKKKNPFPIVLEKNLSLVNAVKYRLNHVISTS